MGVSANSSGSIRLDKWLWFARVVKTRTLAQKLVRGHKIRVNKVKTSNPAKPVGVGDTLTITLERQIKVLEIVMCGIRRGPFNEAAKLYLDLSPRQLETGPGVSHKPNQMQEKVPRPGKLERRKLLELKNRQYFQ